MGGGGVVTPAADQVDDATVLHRAVIDHTVLCEVCGRTGPCVYLVRLKKLSRAATKKAHESREPRH